MVRWSAPAKKDLRQIYDYIARDSKYYAKNVVQNIVASYLKVVESVKPVLVGIQDIK